MMMNNKKIAQDEEGQVAFEFILVFAFTVSLSFLFLYSGTNFVRGYIAHYLTFMTSRTFLVADDAVIAIPATLNYAENRARDTFGKYDFAYFGLRQQNLEFIKPENGNKAVYVGATLLFQQTLSPTEYVGGRDKANYYSESFLGKEPLKMYCLQQICKQMRDSEPCLYDTMHITLFDNGC